MSSSIQHSDPVQAQSQASNLQSDSSRIVGEEHSSDDSRGLGLVDNLNTFEKRSKGGILTISQENEEKHKVIFEPRSQALKAFQNKQLRASISNAKRTQDAADAKTILSKRQDAQISKAISTLVNSSTLPLLVDDPIDNLTSEDGGRSSKFGAKGKTSHAVGTRRNIESTMQATDNYALYEKDMLRKLENTRPEGRPDGRGQGGPAHPVSSTSTSTSTGEVARVSSAKYFLNPPATPVIPLRSNNSLPSLISQTDAIFPKLESGSETQPEGHGKVSGVYKALLGIARTNGPQTKTDYAFHASQAEKGIETQFNKHLFEKAADKSAAGDAASRRGTDGKGKGSGKLMQPNQHSRIPRSNDIFNEAAGNGSRKNREKREAAAAAAREATKNTRLMHAFTLAHDARGMLDPTRLLFDAAVIYDDIGIRDKAIQMYEKSTILCDAEAVVDTYDLTEDPGFRRRIERMADSHRQIFLAKRQTLRADLVFAERERQRLRAMVSKCQLVRLYLLEDDFPAAHKNIVGAFPYTKSPAEHSELLYYFHEVLKEYSNKCFGELSKSQQLVRSSAGPLAEAHISILHELLEEDGRNADVVEWLGKRYAEKLDFDTAYGYYKRATDMREPVRTAIDTRDLWVTRGTVPKNDLDAEYLKGISKNKRVEFTNDEIHDDIVYRSDEYIASGQRDYAWPERKHMGAHIILYEKPSQGWAYGIRMQQERMRALGMEFKLPQNTVYRETDRDLGLAEDDVSLPSVPSAESS